MVSRWAFCCSLRTRAFLLILELQAPVQQRFAVQSSMKFLLRQGRQLSFLLAGIELLLTGFYMRR
jgi:hypothetical protein